jgi:hypothetical protein
VRRSVRRISAATRWPDQPTPEAVVGQTTSSATVRQTTRLPKQRTTPASRRANCRSRGRLRHWHWPSGAESKKKKPIKALCHPILCQAFPIIAMERGV